MTESDGYLIDLVLSVLNLQQAIMNVGIAAFRPTGVQFTITTVGIPVLNLALLSCINVSFAKSETKGNKLQVEQIV